MKKDRHDRILEIIRTKDIGTQQELAEALRESGFEATQATVSRDIRRLGLTKITTAEGKQRYVAAGNGDRASLDKNIRVLRDSVSSIDQAQNILVIKTGSGMAMAAAAALDALQIPEIVGCIAGDDTIMAAVRTVRDTSKVLRDIRRMLDLQ